MLRQGQFFSLSNRRNAALQMFQALRRNTVFWTSCVVYDENHPKFSADRSVTTVNQGLGVEPNAEWAHASEATHRGTPMWSAARTAAVKLALVTSAFGVFLLRADGFRLALLDRLLFFFCGLLFADGGPDLWPRTCNPGL